MNRTRRVFALALGTWLLALVFAPAALAQQKVDLEVTIAQISDEPGDIDPRGAEIHRKLQREFRYESLRVVDSKRLKLGVNEMGKLRLPTGRTLQIVPLALDDRGVLMAVEVEGVLQTDLRVKSGHLVVFGVHQHGPGKLVIAVTPRL